MSTAWFNQHRRRHGYRQTRPLVIDLLECRTLLSTGYPGTLTQATNVNNHGPGSRTNYPSFQLTGFNSSAGYTTSGGALVIAGADAGDSFSGRLQWNATLAGNLSNLGLGLYANGSLVASIAPGVAHSSGGLEPSSGSGAGSETFTLTTSGLYGSLAFGSNSLSLDILHTSTSYTNGLRLNYTFTIIKVAQPTLGSTATQSVNEVGSVRIPLSAGTFQGDSFSYYSLASGPAHGSLGSFPGAAGGSISYTHASGSAAADSFSYTATDQYGFTSAPQTININITTYASTLSTPPTLATRQNTSLVVSSNASVVGNLLHGLTNPDGNPLTLVASNGAHGTVTLNGNTGGYTYTPTSGYFGADSFTVRAHDAIDNRDSATITVPLFVVANPTINSTFQTSPGVPGTNPTNSPQVILSGTAETGSTVTVTQNNTTTSTITTAGTATADGSGRWTFTATGLSGNPSTYQFTVATSDSSSFASATSNALTVIVDTVAPLAPVIASITPNSGISNLTNATGSLTLNGTAESASVVRIYRGSTTTGALVGTVTATGGNWSFPIGAFTNGNYSYTATATDAAGNISPSTTFAFSVNQTAPAAPAFTNITPNSGVSNLTRFNPITLNGTAAANSTVRVYNGATLIGSAVATAGNWSLLLGTLGDGVFNYTATATDLAGNTSTSSSFGFTVDTAAPAKPVLTGISPGASATLTRFHAFTLSGTAEAGSAISVVLAGSSTVVGTATTSGSGNWSVALSGIVDGTYHYTAKATDPAGNTSVASNVFDFTVDSTAPVPPVISTVSPNSGAPNIANQNVLSLSGSAEANSVVSVVIAGTSTVVGTTTATGGSWSIPLGSIATPLTDGLHSYTATATDAAGNTSGVSTTFNLTVITRGPSAPAITAISPNTGPPGVTNSNVLALSGTGQNGTTITVKNASTLAVVGTASVSSGAWSIPLGTVASPLPDGTRTYIATSTDIARNTSSPSSPFSVTVDTHKPAPPVISSVSPDIGSNVSTASIITLTGTAEANSTVTIISNTGSTTTLGTAVASSSGSWVFTTGTLEDGVYPITATATDRANTTSSVSGTFTVTIDTQPVGTPIIMGITPDTGIVGDGVTSANVLTIRGTGAAGNTITLHQVESNTNYATKPVIDSSGNWSLALPALADGTFHFTATSADIHNVTSEPSNPFVVTIDTHTPLAPVILGITPDNGTPNDGITNLGTFTLKGTAEANATVTVTDVDSTLTLGTTIASNSGAWRFPIGGSTPLGSGTYHYTASATDLAGTTGPSSSTYKVVIDTHIPAAPLISTITPDTGLSNTDGITSATSFTLSGTAEANSTVTLLNASTSTILGTTIASGTGGWNFAIGNVTPLAEGAYHYTATATDLAGSISPTATTFSVTVDTHTPAAPVFTGITPDTGSSPTDNVTSANVITLRGTSELQSQITLTDADTDTILGTALTSPAGTWSFAITSALADGVHHYTATTTSLAGITGVSTSRFAVTIDTHTPLAPVIIGISPDTGASNTDGVTSATSFTISGTAEANCVVAIKNADMNTVIGSTLADASGNWSFLLGDVTPIGDGIYHYSAIATDLAGVSSIASSAYEVQVDTHTPSAPSISGITPDTGSNAHDGVTNNPTFSIFGVAEANSTITITNADTSAIMGTTTSDGSGNWSLLVGSPRQLDDGTYHFTATATDLAGTMGTASVAYTVVLTTSRPATPSIGLDPASDSGLSNSDGITNVTTPTFDIANILPGATVELLRNGTVVTTDVAGSGGTVMLTEPSPVPDGTYQYTAKQIDIAGNVSNVSAAQQVIIDTTHPAFGNFVPLTRPVRNVSLASVDLTFSKIIDTNSFTTGVITLTRNGSPVTIPADALSLNLVSGTTYRLAGLGVLTASASLPIDGDYTLSFDDSQIYDIAGNAGFSSRSISFTIDTTPPQLSTLGPVSPNPRNTAVDTVNLVFSKPIDPSTFTVASLAFTVDGTPISLGSGVAIKQISGSSYQVAGLAKLTAPATLPALHAYVLTINPGTISDFAGNLLTSSKSVNFTIDTTVPTVISIAPITPQARNTAVSTTTITFSKPIDLTTFTNAAITLTNNGTPLALGSSLNLSLVGGTSASYQLSGLDTLTASGGTPISGSYVLSFNAATMKDTLGNGGTGLASTSFIIDTTAPTITSITPIATPRGTPVPSVVFNISKPIDTSTLSLLDITLTRNGLTVPIPSSVTVQSLSPTSVQINGLAPLTTLEGKYILTLNSLFNDEVGNAGTGSLPTTFIVDHTAPNINGIVNLTVPATTTAGAVVTYPNIFASDTVDLLAAPVAFSIPSGSLFPVGTTTVNLSTTDHSGNTALNSFTVSVLPIPTTPPTVAPTHFLTTKRGITGLVLQFSAAMNVTEANTLANYQIAQVGGSGRRMKLSPLPLASAAYDPTTYTITLLLKKPLPHALKLQLTVLGAHLADTHGNLLAGSPTGKPGTNFVTTITPNFPAIRTDLRPASLAHSVKPAISPAPQHVTDRAIATIGKIGTPKSANMQINIKKP